MHKLLSLISLLALSVSASAQVTQLFNNGPVANADGLNIKPSSDNTFGYSSNANEEISTADDFTVTGSGWRVTEILFYGYQTMAVPRPFLDGPKWSVLAGSDINTATVVASGIADTWSNPDYRGIVAGRRVAEDDTGSVVRSIYELHADVPDFELAAGNYWLVWALYGSDNYAGPYVPPTADLRPGNAMMSDSGSPFFGIADTFSENQYDLPFAINGTMLTPVPEPSTVVFMLSGLTALGVARRRKAAR